MRAKTIVPLAVGLGVGLVALKLFVNAGAASAKASPAVATVAIVYAATNIEALSEITDTMLKEQQVPKNSVPEGSFKSIAEITNDKRVASGIIPKGSPITEAQLALKGTPPGLVARIPDGYRAVAVKIDESSGVAGWIKAGSRVDVIALFENRENGKTQHSSQVILQNIEVLAVGQDNINTTDPSAAKLSQSATLLVTLEDSPKLHLAGNKGKLSLAMRNIHDTTKAKGNSTTDNDLANPTSGEDSNKKVSLLDRFLNAQAKNGQAQADKTSKLPAGADKTWTVEVLKGAETLQTVDFERKTAKNWQRTGIQSKNIGSSAGSGS